MPGLSRGRRLDQALVCVPPSRLPETLEALKPLRPRAVNLLLHEQPSTDPVEDMVYCRAWAALNDSVMLGPRSFGVQRPHLGLNLSQQRHTALGGRVALVAQSRSIATAVLDWAEDINLGFSAIVSLGDEAALDLAEVLDFLAMDARTDSIALYLEEATSSRPFSSALKAAASVKPVVVLKVGHSQEHLSVQDAVFNALLRRVGAVRIRYFVQLFSALKVLVHTRRPRGRRIALFSNGGGAPQLAMDVMGDSDAVVVSELSRNTVKFLDQFLEVGARTANPVVTYSRLTPDLVKQVVDALVADSGVDGVLVLLAPDPLSDLQATACGAGAFGTQAHHYLFHGRCDDAAAAPHSRSRRHAGISHARVGGQRFWHSQFIPLQPDAGAADAPSRASGANASPGRSPAHCADCAAGGQACAFRRKLCAAALMLSCSPALCVAC
jgi:acetyltransferase